MAKKDERKKDPAAVSLGSRGGKKRMESLSKAERKALGKLAARTRWGKKKESK